MKKGEIYFADLNPVIGHEQGNYRPVIILQNSILNKNLSTVVIAPITKNLKAKGHLTTHFLKKQSSKLAHDSVILLHQITTIDKQRLTNRVSTLNQTDIQSVMEQLKFVF